MHTATDLTLTAERATLRAMRREAGLTLADVADRAGVDKSTLSRFESGKREISKPLLGRVLRVIADELVAQSGRAA